MAYDDIEIEIKIKISEKEFNNAIAYLEENADFKGEQQNLDQYFMPAHKNYLEPKYPFEWLSIRERGDKTIINYKHWYPEEEEISKYCDEYELEVESGEKARKMFSAIGIQDLVTVDKKRKKYLLDEKYEIVLDEVVDLGYYVEIEADVEVGDIDETRSQLFEVAKRIGITTTEEDMRGYPYRLLEEKGLLKKYRK